MSVRDQGRRGGRVALRMALLVAVMAAIAPVAVWAQAGPHGAGHYPTARDQWLSHGPSRANPPATADKARPTGPRQANFGQVGTLWDGGPANGSNGVASERATTVGGTGGPEGDHAATVAAPFDVPGLVATSGLVRATEFRACLYHAGTSAELYVYLDAGDAPPAPPTRDVIYGRSPMNGLPDVVSTSFQDNNTRCAGGFGYPGRQYAFNLETTGIDEVILEPGRYWLAVVGEGGQRAFWAGSSGPGSGLPAPATGRWGSTVFGAAYWTDTAGLGEPYFAFDVDGEPVAPPSWPWWPGPQQLINRIHLPMLQPASPAGVCQTWVDVLNLGHDAAKVAFVLFGDPGPCPPDCAGPLGLECSGVLAPGASWRFLGAALPPGARNGVLFRLSMRPMREVAPDFELSDRPVADYLCETLAAGPGDPYGVVGDCQNYRRFYQAYTQGLEYAGVGMSPASGHGYVHATVTRDCAEAGAAGTRRRSAYEGVAGDRVGAFDPVFGGFGYYLPFVVAEGPAAATWLHVQNAGLECASVEVWLGDAACRRRLCTVARVAPGETRTVDLAGCADGAWRGVAWLRSSHPLAVVADVAGPGGAMSYVASPASYVVYGRPDWASTWLGQPGRAFTGPVAYAGWQGWDTVVAVQNTSADQAARVRLSAVDPSGHVAATLVDWICPDGGRHFSLAALADLPAGWRGSVRVTSEPWWYPGDGPANQPAIAGVVLLARGPGSAAGSPAGAAAYSLLQDADVSLWLPARATHGVAQGAAVLPALSDAGDPTVTTEVVVTDLLPEPGFTAFALLLFDQNGPVAQLCQTISARQTAYYDIGALGILAPGFRGSAVVSAVFSDHWLPDEAGVLRTYVSLGAVAVQRPTRGLGAETAGDWSVAVPGLPAPPESLAEFGGALPVPPAGCWPADTSNTSGR